MTQRIAPADYITTITDVREVALWATADLGYWRERLRDEDLLPFDDGGRAALLLTAIDSKFRGISFRELSISVLVGDGRSAFLAHAFSSSRLLAFAERTLFQTPYQLAHIEVDERVPARMSATIRGGVAFSARMGSREGSGEPADELFEGPIYLPGGHKVFYARLSGAGVRYPFTGEDALEMRPTPAAPIFAHLVASNVAGREWFMRTGAIHARSNTVARGA